MTTPQTSGPAKWPWWLPTDDASLSEYFKAIADRLALMSGAGPANVADAAGLAALVSSGDAFAGFLVSQRDLGLLLRRNAANSAWEVVAAQPTVAARASATIASSTTLSALDFAAPTGSPAFTENTGVFTCAAGATGTYKITLTLTYAANATGVRRAALVSSAGTTVSQSFETVSGTIAQSLTIVWIGTVTAGDTITVQGAQSSGGALGVFGAVTFERIA